MAPKIVEDRNQGKRLIDCMNLHSQQISVVPGPCQIPCLALRRQISQMRPLLTSSISLHNLACYPLDTLAGLMFLDDFNFVPAFMSLQLPSPPPKIPFPLVLRYLLSLTHTAPPTRIFFRHPPPLLARSPFFQPLGHLHSVYLYMKQCFLCHCLLTNTLPPLRSETFSFTLAVSSRSRIAPGI